MSDRCRVIVADVLDWAANYEGPKFHAILCDPPYHLTSIVKRFGGPNAAPVKVKKLDGQGGSPYLRGATGFMGKTWDGGDIAFRSETWAALWEHLYPGAFIMAFAGSRGWHRQAVAIEDAGFVIHPMIAWIFGCLSQDTEILTKDGWEPYHKAMQGTDVLCYNNSAQTFQFEAVEELYVYDYDETAYHIESDRTDQIVSRNHRCLIERGDGLEFVSAERLAAQEVVPVLAGVSSLQGALFGREQRAIPQEEDLWKSRLRLQGDWAAESREVSAGIGAQGRESDLSGMPAVGVESCVVDEGESASILLSELQSQSARGASDPFRGQRKRKDAARDRAGRRAQPGMEGRSLRHTQARKLQTDQVREMPAGVYADGSQGQLCHGASSVCRSGDRPMPSPLGSDSSRRSRSAAQRPEQSSSVCLESGSQTVRASRFTSSTLATITPIHYRGKVWCVRVRSGAFVARRNGLVFITGNSGFPKAHRIGEQERDSDGKLHLNEDGRFTGHRYGLQALKPAMEPIIVAQKPYTGRPVDCITRTGAGALNIDGGRVRTTDCPNLSGNPSPGSPLAAIQPGRSGGNGGNFTPEAGRWPANVVGDGVDLPLFFSVQRQIDEAYCYFYEPKASVAERDAGLSGEGPECADTEGALRDGGRGASGVYTGRTNGSLGKVTNSRLNNHPTVKPVDLCRWLALLLLPPNEYAPRRILVPFAGSGSEMAGAQQAGWDEIVGIEREAEYAEIAEGRLSVLAAQEILDFA